MLAQPPDTTYDRLVGAAEKLFAERGIDAVSLREINRLAGARNSMALHYHFGDRDGLVGAVLAKHARDIEPRRHAILDEYEATGRSDLRSLAAALVRPWAAQLANVDGGPEFLQINADLINRPRPVLLTGTEGTVAASTDRWRDLVEPHLDQHAARLHLRFSAILHASVELGRRARSGPHVDDRLFTSHLIDMVTAILQCPADGETKRLIEGAANVPVARAGANELTPARRRSRGAVAQP